MKRTNILLYLWLAGGLMGCTESDLPPDSGKLGPVPITLQAGNRTKAVVNTGNAFDPLLICFRLEGKEGGYKKTTWTNNASVAAETGVVTFKGYDNTDANTDNDGPLYPIESGFPFDVYITGLHPHGANLAIAPGSARYDIDGEKDIMYAPEVYGNCVDGHRLGGNTDSNKDKPLEFKHLLTQLQFKAYRTGDAEAGEFRITGISLLEVPTSVTISLADGGLERAETTQLLEAKIDNQFVASVDETEPTSVGYALVPAANSYAADVVTSFGTFRILIQPGASGGPLEAGAAHTIKLKLNDKGVVVSQVTAAFWDDIESGDIDL